MKDNKNSTNIEILNKDQKPYLIKKMIQIN